MSPISAGSSFSLQAPGDSPLRSHSNTVFVQGTVGTGRGECVEGGATIFTRVDQNPPRCLLGRFRGELKDVQKTV